MVLALVDLDLDYSLANLRQGNPGSGHLPARYRSTGAVNRTRLLKGLFNYYSLINYKVHSSKYVYNVFLKSKFRPVIHVLRKDGSLMNPTCKILSGKKAFIHYYFFFILCISTAKKKNANYVTRKCYHQVSFHVQKNKKMCFLHVHLMQVVNIRHSLEHVWMFF